MAGVWRYPPVPVLLALTGLAAAGEPAGSRSDRAVGALLGLLLCLAIGLAVAWHHLCRLSAGRYHPRPMGRRALELLRGHWHRLRGWGGPTEEPSYGDGEVTAGPRDEEEELMPWSQNQRLEEDEDEEEEEEKQHEEDEEEQEEDEEEEEEAEGGPESPPGGEQGAGGSAEALLSDLHAFSGTAAWGDTRPSVTAL